MCLCVFSQLHAGKELGNIAVIKKLKPATWTQRCTECCTDVDRFSIQFKKGYYYNNDPNFKMVVLSALFHLDYMFFEFDNGSNSFPRQAKKKGFQNVNYRVKLKKSSKFKIFSWPSKNHPCQLKMSLEIC